MSKPDWATRIQKSRQKKYDEGFEAGVLLAYDLGRADVRSEVIKFLGEHVMQLEIKHRLFGFNWKQRCRCGFYGVFNDHLIALIKGENK